MKVALFVMSTTSSVRRVSGGELNCVFDTGATNDPTSLAPFVYTSRAVKIPVRINAISFRN